MPISYQQLNVALPSELADRLQEWLRTTDEKTSTRQLVISLISDFLDDMDEEAAEEALAKGLN